MKTISSITALALLALASSQALARDGEYYEGVSPNQTEMGIDRNHTASVTAASADNQAPTQKISSGDYYEGIQRPN